MLYAPWVVRAVISLSYEPVSSQMAVVVPSVPSAPPEAPPEPPVPPVNEVTVFEDMLLEVEEDKWIAEVVPPEPPEALNPPVPPVPPVNEVTVFEDMLLEVEEEDR